MTTLNAKAREAAEAAINVEHFPERKLMAAQAITAYLEALPPQPVEVTEEMVGRLRAVGEALCVVYDAANDPNETRVTIDKEPAFNAICLMDEVADMLASRPSGDGIQPEPGTIRVCPERDGRCPHGLECPYAIDRWHCKKEGVA